MVVRTLTGMGIGLVMLLGLATGMGTTAVAPSLGALLGRGPSGGLCAAIALESGLCVLALLFVGLAGAATAAAAWRGASRGLNAIIITIGAVLCGVTLLSARILVEERSVVMVFVDVWQIAPAALSTVCHRITVGEPMDAVDARMRWTLAQRDSRFAGERAFRQPFGLGARVCRVDFAEDRVTAAVYYEGN